MNNRQIIAATDADIPVILDMIKGLAEYERLSDVVTATEDLLRETLFGPSPAAEVLLAYDGSECVGFALFFQNYSTFLAKPGIYLEDLFVRPQARGQGFGIALLREIGRLASERKCGRVEWSVLDWNEPSIGFYKKLGAVPLHDWTVFRLTGTALEQLAAPSPAVGSDILAD